MNRFRTIGVWILIGLLVAFFLAAGFAKLSDPSPHAESFARWGYPDWFLAAVGWAEIGGAVGLCVPIVSGVAALWLGIIMIGAFATHLWFGEFAALPIPLILLGLSAIVGYARRQGLLTLVQAIPSRIR